MNGVQDLVASVSPMYYVSTAVGLTCYFPSGEPGNRRFAKGKWRILYHVIYLFIHLFFILSSVNYRLITKNLSKFDSKIVMFSICTSLVISLVVLVCYNLFNSGINTILTELDDLDKQMSAFGNKIEHSVVFQRILGVILFLLITAVWYTLTMIQSSQLYEYYYWGLFIIQYLITMTMKTQFCVFNIILKYRFLALDTSLKEIIDSTRDISEKQSKLILVQSAQQQPPMTLSSVADKIITLSEFHSRLYNIAKRINLFYSVQILLITGKYFVEITATLYYNLQKFYKTDVHEEERYDWYAFSYFIWALMNCADLFILVYTSDSMCSTANGCKMTLHKVNLNSKDIEMKKEVTAFSLQLLHNDLVLTAAGFFNIDFTLIFNIIGAVTTYLVIFIQFDINDPKNSVIYLNSTTDIATLFSEQSTELMSAISVVNSSAIDY